MEQNSPVTVAHEIENVTTAGDEEQLHGGIVYGDVAKEEIRIARHKDRYIESLRFERYTYKRPGKHVADMEQPATTQPWRSSESCRWKVFERNEPRHERDVWILCNNMNMEAKCDKSPKLQD